MKRSEKVLKIKEIFDKVYADAKCSLDYTEPYQLLIAVVLSAQCTDKRVNIVTKTLFDKYKTLKILRMPILTGLPRTSNRADFTKPNRAI